MAAPGGPRKAIKACRLCITPEFLLVFTRPVNAWRLQKLWVYGYINFTEDWTPPDTGISLRRQSMYRTPSLLQVLTVKQLTVYGQGITLLSITHWLLQN